MVLISVVLCTLTRHEVMNMLWCAHFLDCCYPTKSCVVFCCDILLSVTFFVIIPTDSIYEGTPNGNVEDEPMEMDTGQFEDADD